MPTGGGGTPPADAGQATASCSGGHPQAPAVSAAATNRPDTNRTPTVQPPSCWTPTAVPAAAADRQGVRGVRFRSHPDTGRGSGWAGRRRTRSRRSARRQDRAGWSCSSALVKGPGRRNQRRTAVRLRGHWTRPAEHREPTRPGTADTRDRRRAGGHCGSRHAGQPAAGPSTTRQPCPTGTGPRCADRQIGRLVLGVDLVGSRRIWPAQVGCLVDRVGSRRAGRPPRLARRGAPG
jgi:hypothetical protein